jgi:hypothetical protein
MKCLANKTNSVSERDKKIDKVGRGFVYLCQGFAAGVIARTVIDLSKETGLVEYLGSVIEKYVI